ncbi:MAG: hypothetical protein CVT77_12230 [Alphaproteobacteria bacterium HGW-Alphaproteobacteria-16]|nr:MAG: hypothetical protein CVT77_12230 [Alphaproteobacteria bacterium HGW-Alphaproteobacteria-16]
MNALWTLLGWRGAIALAAFALAGGLALQLAGARADTARAERTLAEERLVHRITVANFRLAAAQARIDDAANARRVVTEQHRISQEVSHEYQTRLATVRTRADALRSQLRGEATANPGSPAIASVPSPGPAPGGSDGATAAAGLPAPGMKLGDAMTLEERLIATEQAIQLDALQSWVRAQATIDNNGEPKP